MKVQIEIPIDGIMTPVPYTISYDGTVRNRKGEILKPFECGTERNKGVYHAVDLYAGGTRYRQYIQRLVGFMWIPNPKPHQYNEVNHKDMNHFNNHGDNLEWTDRKGNMQHAYFMKAHKNLNKGEIDELQTD